MRHGKAYDAGLSFSGLDRAFVDSLRSELAALGVRAFYDYDYQSMLVGELLTEALPGIYRDKCDLFLPIISENYIESHWARTEKRAALERALEENGFVLPIRLDATEIPGISTAIGYLDATKCGLPELVDTVATNLLGKRVLVAEKVHGRVHVGKYLDEVPICLQTETHHAPLAQAHLDVGCGIVLERLMDAYCGPSSPSPRTGLPESAANILRDAGFDGCGYSLQFCLIDENATIVAHPELTQDIPFRDVGLPDAVNEYIDLLLSTAFQAHDGQTSHIDQRFFCWNDSMFSPTYPSGPTQRSRRSIGRLAPDFVPGFGSGGRSPPVFVFGEVHLK